MFQYRISLLIEALSESNPPFPPTDLFNETWLLRLVLDWYSDHRGFESPLAFMEGARWFSRGQLPSAFLARYKSDKLAENWTNADGLIGHFDVGKGGRPEITIRRDALQFTVIEAKIHSRLSTGVKNAAYYDKIARAVACMAEILRQAYRRPEDMQTISFYVLAPREQVEERVLSKYLAVETITEKVQRRVSEYGSERQEWFDNWFLPMMDLITVETITWGDIISVIWSVDTKSADQIAGFYQNCLKYRGTAN